MDEQQPEQPTRVCILCAKRDRETKLTYGHCCRGCERRLHETITGLSRLRDEAATNLVPPAGKGTRSIAFGSRPPLSIDALEPEQQPIELTPGDPSSAVSLVEAIEMYERMIREDRGMVMYGIASEGRPITTRTGVVSTRAVFDQTVAFLAANVEWITTEPTFDLLEFDGTIRRVAATLRALTGDTGNIGTRIECPTIIDEDGSTCRARIRIGTGTGRDNEHVTCRRCGVSWSRDWLLRVAGDDADGWADAEAIAKFAGVSESTIRRWARAGSVRKLGMLYHVGDVRDALHSSIAKAS